jgi:hypothetical protein
MEKLLTLFKEVPEVEDRPGALPLQVTEGRVVFGKSYCKKRNSHDCR